MQASSSPSADSVQKDQRHILSTNGKTITRHFMPLKGQSHEPCRAHDHNLVGIIVLILNIVNVTD